MRTYIISVFSIPGEFGRRTYYIKVTNTFVNNEATNIETYQVEGQAKRFAGTILTLPMQVDITFEEGIVTYIHNI